MKSIRPIYWLFTAITFAVAIALLLAYTPTERSMGDIQKIFYLHLPVAICTFFACLVCFIGSIAYLSTHKSAWDDLASAAARVAVQLCSVVLLTGMIWGKSAWGLWWTWSPRLTFSLVLWLLYVVYLVIRMSVESRQRRAVVAAVYGLIAFLDVPLVYLSVRMMPDIHPTSIELAFPMKVTLATWFVPVILLTAGAIEGKFRLNRARSESDLARVESSVRTAPSAAMPWAGGLS
jgi:heme exporter protein C